MHRVPKVRGVTATMLDAFRHHIWATLQLLDVCAPLSQEQLDAPVPGLYGGILDTMRHTVGADAWYLHVLSGGSSPNIDEDTMNLQQLRTAMEGHGSVWEQMLNVHADVDADVVAHRADGTEGHATAGIRLAQALHHGTDHRSQVCTALTTLGIEPPEIDVWAYGETVGRVSDQ